MMTVEEIADIDVGGVSQTPVPEAPTGETGPSVVRRRSFKLADGRFRIKSSELASQRVIAMSEGSESAEGASSQMGGSKGKKRSHGLTPEVNREDPEVASSNVDLAQVVFDLRRRSAIQSEELKRLMSNYFGLVSNIGDLEWQVARLKVVVEEIEGEIRELKNNP